MNNLNNMPGMPMGGQQQQQQRTFAMQFQNPMATGNPKTGPIDYSWQQNVSREGRDNVIKTLYVIPSFQNR
jgi:hypothetical protein